MYSRLSLVVASALAFGCQGHQPKKTTQSGQQGKAVPASKTGAMVDGLSFKLKLPEGFRLLRPTEPVPSGLKDQFDQDALVNLERSDGILLVPNGKNPQGALIAVKRLPDAAPPLDTKERCKDAFASKPGAKKLDVTVKFETVGPYDACVWTSAAPKGQKPLQYTRAWLKVGNKALLASCRYPKGDKKTLAACLAAVGSTVARDRVRLDMYVMSKCPYGAEALRAARRVVSQLGQSVELSLDYIVEHKGGRFDSLHGQSEVTGNIQQLCAIKYHSRDKWLKFIDCVSEDFQAIPSNYETCAVQAKLDKGKMKTCVDGKEGKLLLTASAKRARALNAQGSPTIYIDGRPHAGGRSSSDLVYGACMAIQKGAPALCTKLPKPIVVKAVLIEDKRCKERSCDEFGIKMQPAIRARFFPGLSVERLDWSSPRAQALYKRLGLTALPSWIFAKGVKKARKYDQISRFLTETKDGEYLKLAVPASFDPKKKSVTTKKTTPKMAKSIVRTPTAGWRCTVAPSKSARSTSS
jgi:glutaredoxin